MSKKRRQPRKREPTKTRTMVFTASEVFNEMISTSYTPLDQLPEVVACARKIAELIGSATIHLMANTKNGDERIVNELSRLIDINPMPNMTRSNWMESCIMTMLLYGRGNAVVVPHTVDGYLEKLEPIPAWRTTFEGITTSDYRIRIDNTLFDPADVIHFVYNPDKFYPWKGTGVKVALRDVLQNLQQAAATKKAFMSSEYKPSLIVKVDAIADEFSTPEGRQVIVEDYMKPAKRGEPWIIPAEQMDVKEVKPLTLADLAINETVQLDRRMVAAMFGVPPFIVGVGEYKKDEWNMFVQTKIMSMAKSIASELTKKLIINPKWYLTFNVWSLMDYDMKAVSDVLLAGSDRGFVNGDEWRDRVHLNPAGLTEYRVLENYIPTDMSGKQKKLVQDE